MSLLLKSCGMKVKLPRSLDPCGHFGEAKPDSLMLDDRLAETVALLRVGECVIIGGLRDTDRLRRYADAVGVRALEDDLVAATNCAEDVIVGKFEPIQRDLADVHHPMPELLFPTDHGVTGHARPDKESCESILAQIRIGVGKQYCRTRRATAGDEDFVPVDCPAVAVVRGASSQTRKIRSRVRFTQQKRDVVFSLDDRPQELFLLLLRAELQ